MPPFDADEQIVQLHHITAVDSLDEGKEEFCNFRVNLVSFLFIAMGVCSIS